MSGGGKSGSAGTIDLTDESKHGVSMSFYFTLCDRMPELESMLVEFYSKLLSQLDLLNNATLMLNGAERTLTMELLQSVLESKEDVSVGVEFPLFRGAYIRLFEDGSLFQKVLFRVFDDLGEARLIWLRWEMEYRLNGKSNSKLRTFYRFIDYSFIAQLPLHHYTAFQADTLLYCEWRLAHPNLIGFHLLILTWMLDIPEFFQFAPLGIRTVGPLTSPLMRHFWALSGLKRIRLASTVPTAANNSAEEKPRARLTAKKRP